MQEAENKSPLETGKGEATLVSAVPSFLHIKKKIKAIIIPQQLRGVCLWKYQFWSLIKADAVRETSANYMLNFNQL